MFCNQIIWNITIDGKEVVIIESFIFLLRRLVLITPLFFGDGGNGEMVHCVSLKTLSMYINSNARYFYVWKYVVLELGFLKFKFVL